MGQVFTSYSRRDTALWTLVWLYEMKLTAPSVHMDASTWLRSMAMWVQWRFSGPARDAFTINVLPPYMEYNRISDFIRKFETSNLMD